MEEKLICIIKHCIKCNRLLTLNHFNKNKTGKDGTINTCKDCEKIYKKEHYTKNFEYISNYKKEWSQKNREHVLQNKREYYLQNKERMDLNSKINYQK